jgi:hypothetical protein
LAACSPENEAPSITSFSLDSTTIQKEEGALLKFSYSFSDDSGLNQFRVSVIDDFSRPLDYLQLLGIMTKIMICQEHLFQIHYL